MYSAAVLSCSTSHVPCAWKGYHYKHKKSITILSLRGQGGVPWVQIMENEFECLVVRRGDGGHFAEKFVKKYCS